VNYYSNTVADTYQDLVIWCAVTNSSHATAAILHGTSSAVIPVVYRVPTENVLLIE
ncbi:unnamed protein product, partial [Acanthoscelides obtectus]